MSETLIQAKLRIWMAALFLLIGIFAPIWLNGAALFPLWIERLTSLPDSNQAMMAGLVFVLWNTIRFAPQFLGSFLLADEIGDRLERPWLKTAIPIVLLLLLDGFLYSFLFLRYDPTGFLLLMLISLFIMHKIGSRKMGPIMKSLVLAQLLIGIQWLAVAPVLSSFGFGGEPVALQIKRFAMQSGIGQAANWYGAAFCLGFLTNAVISSYYFVMSETKWSMSQTLYLTRLEAIESRAGREVLQLVHDLKTPLTTIEGLNSLIGMRLQDSKIREYNDKIDASIQAMSDMISEILYQDRKSWCRVDDLINYICAARLSGTEALLELDLSADPSEKVWINKIRITRAIINLIDNAFDAVAEREDGRVTLKTLIRPEQIWIGISDNGPGIPQQVIHKIWQAGYSTKNHPGIGLSFVWQVAEAHRATVSIDREWTPGTLIWLQLPRGGNGNEDPDHR